MEAKMAFASARLSGDGRWAGLFRNWKRVLVNRSCKLVPLAQPCTFTAGLSERRRQPNYGRTYLHPARLRADGRGAARRLAFLSRQQGEQTRMVLFLQGQGMAAFSAIKGTLRERAHAWTHSLAMEPRHTHMQDFLCTQASTSTSLHTSEGAKLTVPSQGAEKENWAVKMLFDGACPLCMREVNMLRERNKTYGTIRFVDISAMDYSPEENAGVDFETAMGRIHAILPDGTILYDIKAFKKLYEEVGLGWVYAFTKIRLLAKIADAIYSVWAKYRLPITGRPPLIQVLEARQKKACTMTPSPYMVSELVSHNCCIYGCQAKEACGPANCRID